MSKPAKLRDLAKTEETRAIRRVLRNHGVAKVPDRTIRSLLVVMGTGRPSPDETRKRDDEDALWFSEFVDRAIALLRDLDAVSQHFYGPALNQLGEGSIDRTKSELQRLLQNVRVLTTNFEVRKRKEIRAGERRNKRPSTQDGLRRTAMFDTLRDGDVTDVSVCADVVADLLIVARLEEGPFKRLRAAVFNTLTRHLDKFSRKHRI